MDLYYNHIVDILTKNTGIGRDELYKKSGLNKRGFVTEINSLLSTCRISNQYDRFKYSPRVLILVEYEKRHGIKTGEFQLNYLPTDVLNRGLNYINSGTEPEDCLEYELEITGYEISEKFKPFFENQSDIILDFNKFKYYLWAKYLYQRDDMIKISQESLSNVVYLGVDQEFAERVIKNMRDAYLSNGRWFQFQDSIQAMQFLENKLEVTECINLIIVEDNMTLNCCEFIEAVRELEMEFEKKYIKFNIPIIVLKNQTEDMNVDVKNSEGRVITYQYSISEDFYVLGNVVKSLCKSW